MPSIFTRIVQGEIPCYKVAETDRFLAFLDINPVAQGHTLVIPKQEIDYIFDLDDELYLALHAYAKRVARAIESVVPCPRIGMTVVGLEVPHAHIHLVPLIGLPFIDFSRPRLQMTRSEMSALAARIGGAML